MKVRCNIAYLDSRVEVKDAYCDHAKLNRVFGKIETTSLEEGLIKMVDWAAVIGPKESKKFANIEIEQNLPKGWIDGS